MPKKIPIVDTCEWGRAERGVRYQVSQAGRDLTAAPSASYCTTFAPAKASPITQDAHLGDGRASSRLPHQTGLPSAKASNVAPQPTPRVLYIAHGGTPPSLQQHTSWANICLVMSARLSLEATH